MKPIRKLSEEQIRLINDLSYTFIDAQGNEQIQSIRDFTEQNEPFFEQLPHISRREQKAAADFMARKKASFGIFQLPDRVVWDMYQTGIRNQKNRDTCSAFAMVAAIEARYKRDFGLDLDLSEQFFWHSYKSTSLDFPKKYKYENQSSIWGGGNSGGVKAAVNFAIPLEEDCPYRDQSEMIAVRDQIPEAGELKWKKSAAENMVTQEEVDAFEYSPLYIPDSARQKARYGAAEYVLLEQSTVRSPWLMEWIISWGNEVIVDAKLKWKMNPDTQILEYSGSSGGGNHVFLVVGYDRTEQVFYIKNSYGEDGFIRVSYEFAEKCFNSGSIMSAVRDPEQPQSKGRTLGRWQMNHDGWKGELIIRRYTNEHNASTRLGHYYGENGAVKGVNGLSVHDGRGLKFYISGGPDTDPAVVTGQTFTIDVFSRDVVQAAGDTAWHNIPFGVYLSRDPFQSTPGANFQPQKWLGSWSMNHDGWQGKLRLLHIIPVPFSGTYLSGEYQPHNGPPIAIFGNLHMQHPHIFHFNIPFSDDNSQPFTLHFHTWSEDLASGYTYWNGLRFGVVAFKE